jgi:hypothetical protein
MTEPQRAGKIDVPVGSTLACYVKAADLEQEYLHPAIGQTVRATVKAILDKNRKCAKWDPYIPQFSPKEHLHLHQQQQFARQMERNLRTFEEQLERSRRKFETQLQAETRRFHKKLAFAMVLLAVFVTLAYALMPLVYTVLLKARIVRVLGF